MQTDTISSNDSPNVLGNVEGSGSSKPLVMADGQIVTDAGHLLMVQYVDIAGPRMEQRPTTLVKGTESEYSLSHHHTIRISTPHRFRDAGETMIRDHQEGRAERNEEDAVSKEYTQEREEQEQALRVLGVTNVNLGRNTRSASNRSSNAFTYGGGSWVFCTAILPTTEVEWKTLRHSLPSSYTDYTTIHQPSRFAQAIGLMFMDQFRPQAKDGTFRKATKHSHPITTLHDCLLLFHGPVLYTVDVYGFLHGQEHTELRYIYPLFVKDGKYEDQREYRFLLVGNDAPSSEHMDLRVSGMMRDSLVPVRVRSEVRVESTGGSQETDKGPSPEPNTYTRTENKAKRQTETWTITLTSNGRVVQREVRRREFVVSVSSESIISRDAVSDLRIGEERNVARSVEKIDEEVEVDGVTVATTTEEKTRIGYLDDGEDADSYFTIENRAEAKIIFEAAEQLSTILARDNAGLRDVICDLVESVDGREERTAELASSAWHGLRVIANLHAQYGNVVKEIEVERDRFILISLKKSPRSRADGKLLVGPLGTYAYVLRKDERVKWGHGGEDNSLVLFPDAQAAGHFEEFGWVSGEMSDRAQ